MTPLSWVRPLTRWHGCLPSTRGHDPRMCRALGVASAPCGVWMPLARPTINQNGPSCAGHAVANAVELLILHGIGAGTLGASDQLDGDACWRKGRELYYDGDPGGGLTLEQAGYAAIEMDLLPAGTLLVRVGPTWAEIAAQLPYSPLVVGHVLTAGHDPDRVAANGCIDHTGQPVPGTGHARCIIGAIVQSDADKTRRYLVDENSWGPQYGFKGYTIEEDWHHARDLIGGPIGFSLPPNWSSWRGWEQWVRGRG